LGGGGVPYGNVYGSGFGVSPYSLGGYGGYGGYSGYGGFGTGFGWGGYPTSIW